MGGTVSGVDFCKNFIAYGQSKNPDLIFGSYEKLIENGQADVIILNHILEHIVNPFLFLTAIYDSLQEDGVLHIDIPEISSIPSVYNNDIFCIYKMLMYIMSHIKHYLI